VWRLVRPASPSVAAGALLGFALMLLMHFGRSGAAGGGGPNTLLLLLSGLAGASAMILPGVSGGYLLLLLGQYERILGAIDQLKQGLLGAGGGGPDPALLMGAMAVVVPVGIGVAVGVIGVSNLLKWLLDRYRKPTLGALLGLLFGAVVGLWPFQHPAAPQAGDLFQGRELRAEDLGKIDPEDWALETFDPSGGQVAAALGLVAAGLGATLLIDRIGGGRRPRNSG
jgi:putative membrane protein